MCYSVLQFVFRRDNREVILGISIAAEKQPADSGTIGTGKPPAISTAFGHSTPQRRDAEIKERRAIFAANANANAAHADTPTSNP